MPTDDLETRRSLFDRCVRERDVELAGGVLDDEFELVLVVPALTRMPRERWLQLLPDYVTDSLVSEEQQVSIDGDVAVVLQRARMQATVLGQDRSGTFVLSDTWRLRDDGWRLWRRHSTPLTAGALPGAGTPA